MAKGGSEVCRRMENERLSLDHLRDYISTLIPLTMDPVSAYFQNFR